MANEILHALLAASLVAGAVILLLCADRRPMRRAFGARLAYMAWAAVPVAMAETALAALYAVRLPTPVQQMVAPLRHMADAGLPAASITGSLWQQWQQWLPSQSLLELAVSKQRD